MEYKSFRVLGLMSGTSMDGIDLSIIETNGKDVFCYYKNVYHEYSKHTKKKLFKLLNDFNTTSTEKFNKKINNVFISKLYVDVIKKRKLNFNLDVIGFHGQTIYHNPDQKISLQLGDPRYISNSLNLPVVYDFRSNDLNHGGQGAPLAPIYHKFLIKKNKFTLPSIILNIGGISNISYWDGKNLIGFDTGPGNCLLDDYLKKKINLSFDKDGKIASKGKIFENFVKKFLKDPFFLKNFPKSLDRNYFNHYLSELEKINISLEDAMATLSEITARTVSNSIKKLPKEVKTILISGGGSHNKFLLSRLKNNLKAKVIASKSLINVDFIESELIAYITARKLNNLPITFPKTTGVIKPLCGGKIININYKNPF